MFSHGRPAAIHARKFIRPFGILFPSLVLSLASLAQSHSGFPVDITPGPSPQAVMADGRAHLLYELHLTNYVSLPIQLTALDVLGDGASPLASYHGEGMDKIVIPVEKLSLASSPSENTDAQTIGEGHAVVIFVDVTLDSAVRPPAELHHRFSFSVARKSKPNFETTFLGPAVPVVQQPILFATAASRTSLGCFQRFRRGGSPALPECH